MNFREYNKDELKAISSRGGKASVKSKTAPATKSFKEIVQESITNEDLLELYKGLMISAKKGNAKAIDMLLSCLDKDSETYTSLEDFINEY